MTYEKEEEELDENGADDGQQPAVDVQARSVQPSSDELAARLAKAEGDAAGYFAQLQRTIADFDNYRKRMLKEREEFAKAASERIIHDIIEPVENLDRALESAKNVKSVKKLRDGVALTRSQIWSVLERHGLRRIETCGAKFDARWHEAVEQACDDSLDDGTIAGEICSGYVLNGKVLRCAKVKVSRKSARETKEG
ncbi:MAG: nucleotide exchange factor GrpE [Methanobacteriota archaeon]